MLGGEGRNLKCNKQEKMIQKKIQAKALQEEGKAILEQAKREVEEMIIG